MNLIDADAFKVSSRSARRSLTVLRPAREHPADSSTLLPFSSPMERMKSSSSWSSVPVRRLLPLTGTRRRRGYQADLVDHLDSNGCFYGSPTGGGIIDMMNRRLRERLTEEEILQVFVDVCEVRIRLPTVTATLSSCGSVSADLTSLV